MLITELDVVNDCLASMGESPANSLNVSNPFITSAKNALANAQVAEQSVGWFFNIETVRLLPTVDQEYYVPADCLALTTEKTPNNIVIRGRRLYDRSVGEYYRNTKPIKVEIIRNVPFDDLPFHAQRMIKAATVVTFQRSYDGDEIKIRDAEREYALARQFLMAEHIRSVRANMIYHGQGAEYLHNIYYHTSLLPHRG